MKTIFLLIVLIFLGGCLGWGDIEPPSDPVTHADLVGTFVANYKAGMEEWLLLRADSSYVYYFTSEYGFKYVDTNRWELHNESGDSGSPRVRLYNFRTMYALEGMCFSKDAEAELDTTLRIYHPYVFKRDDMIRLVRCPNWNQFYIKQ